MTSEKSAKDNDSSSEEGKVRIGGIVLSNPDRILYPDQGLTKRALAEYYEQVGDWILPYVEKRPLTLVRCPRGRSEKCFYQKHFSDSMPEALRGVPIREKQEERTYIVLDDLKGLISLIQLGVLEIHPWGSREDRIERPDQLVFDLDPGESVEWKWVVQGAFDLRERLGAAKLESFVRTSGGKGLHVVVPIDRRSDWDEAKEFSGAVAGVLVEQCPDRYIATMSKKYRKGKVFIDYFRNTRGATSVASYSSRARPDAPVATPLSWDELTPDIRSTRFTVQNLPRRLAALSKDPWKRFFQIRQSITQTARRQVGLEQD